MTGAGASAGASGDPSGRTSGDPSSGIVEPAPLVQPFDAELAMPGSKSHANRAIVVACLLRGTTVLDGATPCDDVAVLVDNLRTLGFSLRWLDRDRGRLWIDGGLPARAPRHDAARGAAPVVLDCGLAGTALRFLLPVACRVPGEWIVTGNARMQERPIAALVEALRSLGADLDAPSGCPPVRVRGGSLVRGGAVRLDPSASSQFASALLLAGASLEGGVSIELLRPLPSQSYVDLTRRVIADFGGEVSIAGDRVAVERPAGRAPAGDYPIEGDWSAGGAFEVLAALTSSRFRATNLDPASAQGDRRMPELVARLRAAPGDVELDVSDTPDQCMNLAVLAAARRGRTRFLGAGNLRLKESDRLAVLARELGKAGVRVDEHADGVTVHGPARVRPAELDPHGDHRFAFAFAILAATTPGIRIRDPGCVSKSHPRFFADLDGLRAQPRCIAVVGMRAAGKTTFARDLADALGLVTCDTDAEFAREHGDIRHYVTAHGWPAFRACEAAIVARCLRPGRVVALGGGAVETAEVREALRAPHGPLVVWLQETVATLQARISAEPGARPALGAGADAVAEIDSVLAARTPHYESVQHLTLPAGLDRRTRVTACTAWLRSLTGFAKDSVGVEGHRSIGDA